jgi:hypothetical protein
MVTELVRRQMTVNVVPSFNSHEKKIDNERRCRLLETDNHPNSSQRLAINGELIPQIGCHRLQYDVI